MLSVAAPMAIPRHIPYSHSDTDVLLLASVGFLAGGFLHSCRFSTPDSWCPKNTCFTQASKRVLGGRETQERFARLSTLERKYGDVCG